MNAAKWRNLVVRMGILGWVALSGRGALGALRDSEVYDTAHYELRYGFRSGGSEVAIAAISPRADIPDPEGGRDLCIPETIEGLPVTYVGKGAGMNLEDLRSLELPASVVRIGSRAFAGCNGLTSVRVLSTTVKCETGAFAACPSIVHAEIPGHLAFSKVFPKSCGALRGAVVVEGSTKLANNSFKGCTNLTEVTLPLGLEEIGNGAFELCTELASLEIPPSVTLVGSAFNRCASLAEVVFPEGLQKVGRFSKCASLKTVTFQGDCPKGGGFDAKAKSAGVVVRAPASAKGWPVNGRWRGGTLVFYNQGDVDYDVPEVAAEDVVSGIAVGKSIEVPGCIMDYQGKVTGILALKLSGLGKKGCRLNATATDLLGKSILMKSKVEDISGGAADLKLKFFSRGRSLQITLGKDTAGNPAFTGWFANDVVTSAQIGGALEREAEFSFPEGHPASLPQGAVEQGLLPSGERVGMDGGKWVCAKAAQVNWKKAGAAGGGAWVVDGGKSDAEKRSPSGLKLKYRPRKGTFTGSYKAYVVKDGRGRKTTVKVTGVVVNGVGYGVATVKDAAPWRILVR